MRANCYEKLGEEMEQAGATAQDSAQKLAEIQKLFFKDLATTYKYLVPPDLLDRYDRRLKASGRTQQK